MVLVLDDVEDLLGIRRGAAAGRGAAALPLRRRRGRSLCLHALLEGFVTDEADAIAFSGLGLLLPGSATGTARRLRLGGLLVHGGIRPARAQSEGDSLLVLLLAAAHHHLVHAAQARRDGLDRGGGEHQDAEGDQHGVEDDDGHRWHQCLERGGGEIAEHATATGQGRDAVGWGRQPGGDRGDGGDGGEQDRDPDGDAGVGAHLIGASEHPQRRSRPPAAGSPSRRCRRYRPPRCARRRTRARRTATIRRRRPRSRSSAGTVRSRHVAAPVRPPSAARRSNGSCRRPCGRSPDSRSALRAPAEGASRGRSPRSRWCVRCRQQRSARSLSTHVRGRRTCRHVPDPTVHTPSRPGGDAGGTVPAGADHVGEEVSTGSRGGHRNLRA